MIIIITLLHYLDFGFILDSRFYPNNSVVTLTDIGYRIHGPYLFCLTPNTDCCSDTETPNEANVTGEWYLPDGTLLSSAENANISRVKVTHAVRLHRTHNTSPTGVYRCDVPDVSGTTQSIYVGIYQSYPQTEGRWMIVKALFYGGL